MPPYSPYKDAESEITELHEENKFIAVAKELAPYAGRYLALAVPTVMGAETIANQSFEWGYALDGLVTALSPVVAMAAAGTFAVGCATAGFIIGTAVDVVASGFKTVVDWEPDDLKSFNPRDIHFGQADRDIHDAKTYGTRIGLWGGLGAGTLVLGAGLLVGAVTGELTGTMHNLRHNLLDGTNPHKVKTEKQKTVSHSFGQTLQEIAANQNGYAQSQALQLNM